MSKSIVSFIFSSFIVTCIQSAVVWDSPTNLQPVHGLYVKPSIDGTTGDLYVAATEENGVNSQWLTDQPINFLAAASENQQATLPVPFTSSVAVGSSPQEETITTQKRAVLTSSPIKYSLPAEGNLLPYVATEETNTPCSHSTAYYSPFQYFYPQILSTIAKDYNSQKDPSSDEGVNHAQPVAAWPTKAAVMAYPFQYVMLDPSIWAKHISATSTKPSAKDASARNIY